MSDSIQDILEELGRAVAGAMSGADPVHDVVQRLRRHGYQFELLLDLRATPDETVLARLGAGALHLAATAQSENAAQPEDTAQPDVTEAQTAEPSTGEASERAADGQPPRAVGSRRTPTRTETPSASTEPPRFTLDAADAAFLRQIGIDPSRTGRRRRR
ncbi:MAG: hypothetical protein AAGC60_11865 [Acidobacteriota bacterium]